MEIRVHCNVKALSSVLKFSFEDDHIPSVGDVLCFAENRPDGRTNYWEMIVTARSFFYGIGGVEEGGAAFLAKPEFVHLSAAPCSARLAPLRKEQRKSQESRV